MLKTSSIYFCGSHGLISISANQISVRTILDQWALRFDLLRCAEQNEQYEWVWVDVREVCSENELRKPTRRKQQKAAMWKQIGHVCLHVDQSENLMWMHADTEPDLFHAIVLFATRRARHKLCVCRRCVSHKHTVQKKKKKSGGREAETVPCFVPTCQKNETCSCPVISFSFCYLKHAALLSSMRKKTLIPRASWLRVFLAWNTPTTVPTPRGRMWPGRSSSAPNQRALLAARQRSHGGSACVSVDWWIRYFTEYLTKDILSTL